MTARGRVPLRWLVALSVVLLATACAPGVPIVRPDAPQAQLNDRLTADDDGANPRGFALVAIDGEPIANALRPRAGGGYGSMLSDIRARTVEARKAAFTIRGQTLSRPGIDTLIKSAAGRIVTVEGTVTFEPKPGRIYRVNGTLGPEASAVWIEDFETGEVVSEKVSGAPR